MPDQRYKLLQNPYDGLSSPSKSPDGVVCKSCNTVHGADDRAKDRAKEKDTGSSDEGLIQGRIKGRILITGGLGYIGSHITLALARTRKYRIVIADNFVNTRPEAYDNLHKALSIYGVETLVCVIKTDARTAFTVASLDGEIDLVIHLAAHKSVSDSETHHSAFFENNFMETVKLVDSMAGKCARLIFASSAAAGGPSTYGATKLYCEEYLKDVASGKISLRGAGRALDKPLNRARLRHTSLRYYNPIGCHESGLLSDCMGVAGNLLNGLIKSHLQDGVLKIYGTDHNTPDGTCVRDFIDINHLADYHVKLVGEMMDDRHVPDTIHLGSGVGTSVRQFIDAFIKVTTAHAGERYTRIELLGARDGDPARVVSNHSILPVVDLEKSIKSAVHSYTRLFGWRYGNPAEERKDAAEESKDAAEESAEERKDAAEDHK